MLENSNMCFINFTLFLSCVALTEQIHVSLYLSAMSSLSGLVGKPTFKVKDFKLSLTHYSLWFCALYARAFPKSLCCYGNDQVLLLLFYIIVLRSLMRHLTNFSSSINNATQIVLN
jgi:hypothetical protein